MNKAGMEIRFDKNAKNLPAGVDVDKVYHTTLVEIHEIGVGVYVAELQKYVDASLLDDGFWKKVEEAWNYFEKVEDEDVDDDDYFYYGVFMRHY